MTPAPNTPPTPAGASATADAPTLIREVPVGGVVEVLADDPAAKTDLPAWCVIKSHDFVAAAELPVGWSFLVRRSY